MPKKVNRKKTFSTNPINEELSESIYDYSQYSFMPVSEFEDNYKKGAMDTL